jgi:hypothetical protein
MLVGMIIIVLIFTLQYSINKYRETFPPLAPQAMTYQEEMQIDFHRTITALAHSLKPGVNQEFEFKGVRYHALYIGGMHLNCFYEIEPISGQRLNLQSAMFFKAPKTDCADGPTYNELDAERTYNQHQIFSIMNLHVVYPPPGLGTPQHPPSARPAGFASRQGEMAF